MDSNLQEPKFSTMRVHPDAIVKLKEGETLYRRKKGAKPHHSDALRMAVDAWIRELKAA